MLNSEELRSRLHDAGIATVDDIQGCSLAQVTEIENLCGARLPESYVDFMSHFGVIAGRFMRDVDFLYPAVLTLSRTAQDILNDWEHGKLCLPIPHHVFSMRQGEQFMFFDLREQSRESAVFYYIEGRGLFQRIADSFWAIIEREFELSEEHYSRARNDPNYFAW